MLPEVIVSSGSTANTLGVVRCFGRRGIPVTLLEMTLKSPARYSRYVTNRLRGSSRNRLIELLLNYGAKVQRKPVIIPTGDEEVVELARGKKALEPYFLLSLPESGVVETLVDKNRFYRLAEERGYAHPRTIYPRTLDELRQFGRDFSLPFLVKPAHSLPFQERFMKKCFLIRSLADLDRSASVLEGSDLEVMIQEIIPGSDFFEFSVYLDRDGEPKGICSWDRLRQYPPDFGNGTFCRNKFRPEAIDLGLEILRAIGYRGLAAVELKRDPRDLRYRVIEINPRTTLQNRLAAACGVDMEYLAYLDLTGRPIDSIKPPDTGMIWIDDFTDLFSSLTSSLSGKRTGDRLSGLSGGTKRVRSVAAWDDPIPLLARSFFLAGNLWRLFSRRKR
jgi:predicted ATP-grasp superfamily ATP-dependent carboligase